MGVCTIIGHRELFDADVDGKLTKAIAAIIRQNEEVDFWFHGFHNTYAFAQACLLAIMRAKAKYPQKKVVITLVAQGKERLATDELDMFTGWQFPMCVFDRVLVPPYAEELMLRPEGSLENADMAHNRRVWKKIERWMLRESDYCLCYAYRELMEPKTSLYQYALRIKGLKMLDLTNPETTAFFRERVMRFPSHERDVFTYWDQGESLKSIGERFGITGTAVERRLGHVRKKLWGLGKDRMQKIHPDAGIKRCGIVGIGDGTEKEGKELYRTLAYLYRNHEVKEYWVGEEVLTSDYFEDIKKLVKRFRGSKLVVVTMRQEENPDLKILLRRCLSIPYRVEHYNPDCKSIRARRLRTIKYIMDSAEFCVYSSSSDTSFKDSIMRHVGGRKPKVAFDIGHPDVDVVRYTMQDSCIT